MAVGGGQPSALQCTVYYTVYGIGSIEGLTSVVSALILIIVWVLFSVKSEKIISVDSWLGLC